MHLNRLSLLNFKNIREAQLDFSPRINCFVGDNGTGKTNLLDAIHYVPNVSQTPSVQNGMLVGAILVPVALTAVQFVLHLFFGLTDAQHARCVRELAGQDTDRS